MNEYILQRISYFTNIQSQGCDGPGKNNKHYPILKETNHQILYIYIVLQTINQQ